MTSIWMGISPGPRATRLIALHRPDEAILKARLGPSPCHPRALATLLEAVAMWEGSQVRAALCVDEQEPSFATSFYREVFPGYEQTPLYDLAVVSREHRRRRDDGLGGMGNFQDLRRMVAREVAR
jgi:hypothetical protein